MSDFFSSGWSLFVAAATVLGLVFCLVLLVLMARRKVMAVDNTTGHIWDEDLRELNNPLPRWWLWLFVATLVFAAVYLALYPGLGSLPGRLDWSSEAEHRQDKLAAQAAAAPAFARFAATPAATLARDPLAMAAGERLFANNCATCHGLDAHGSKGFPNLTDRDWLWGGTPEKIAETIANGRRGQMPPMAAAVGTSQDVVNLANHVLSLSKLARGRIIDFCEKGRRDVRIPDLVALSSFVQRSLPQEATLQ